MATWAGTTLTRVAFDESPLGSHVESWCGVRNRTRPAPIIPSDIGILLLIIFDESTDYSVGLDPEYDPYRVWEEDLAEYRELWRTASRWMLKPRIFGWARPPATDSDGEFRSHHYGDFFQNRSEIFDGLFGLTPPGISIPSDLFDQQTVDRRNNGENVVDGVDRFSSTGIFLGRISGMLQNEQIPSLIGVVMDPSPSMHRPVSAHEPGLFVADFNGVSLAWWINEFFPQVSLSYMEYSPWYNFTREPTIFPTEISERWLAYTSQVIRSIGRTQGWLPWGP